MCFINHLLQMMAVCSQLCTLWLPSMSLNVSQQSQSHFRLNKLFPHNIVAKYYVGDTRQGGDDCSVVLVLNGRSICKINSFLKRLMFGNFLVFEDSLDMKRWIQRNIFARDRFGIFFEELLPGGVCKYTLLMIPC